MWAANKELTAAEAAQKQFRRNGETFGADTVEEYVDQAHAFLAKPPSGVERATRSRNGDQLLYDPKSNTFLVATRDGAPRTMFKPDDGAEYWANQKRQASGRARNGGGDDRG
jgi:pyocin large subunit-like protein